MTDTLRTSATVDAHRHGFRLLALTAAALALGTPPATAQRWRPWSGARLDGEPAACTDSDRGRIVLVGTRLDRVTLETFEWDGASLLRWSPATPPPRRGGTTLAYDAERRRTILFGGTFAGTTLGDTWAWDGATWSQLQPTASPSPRWGAAAAFDAARGRLVLFGGRDVQMSAETWEWDGATWTQAHPAVSPSGRVGAAMAYDAARARVFLFGGTDGGDRDDTWTWDGIAWQQVRPTVAPTSRSFAAATYDAARQRVVLSGGLTADPDTTWEWDGASWTPIHTAASPSRRWGAAMAYDAVQRRAMLFGGHLDESLQDTWAWDGRAWQQVSARTPTPRVAHAMTYDAARARVVLFGGWLHRVSGQVAGDTWEWDGAGWVERTPPLSPSPRYAPALTFDRRRGRVVLFGGGDGVAGWGADTWEWDGSTWRDRTPVASPPAMAGPAMAHDDARGRSVLYGHPTASPSTPQTWEWDGVRWSQRLPATTPPATLEAERLAFEPVHRHTLLLGVTGDGSRTTQTWEWDGTTWTQRQPSHAPPAAAGYVLVAGGQRRRVRAIADGIETFAAWEWDGNDWLATSAPQVLGRPDFAVAYDEARRALVLLGTARIGEWPVLNGTWLFDDADLAVSRSFGAGCGSRTGEPRLAGSDPIRGQALTLDLASARPHSLCAFGLSPRLGHRRFGRCVLYLAGPLALAAASTDGRGFASLRLGVPPDPAMLRLEVLAQAFVDDPAARPTGVAFTAGVRLQIGE